MPAYVYNDPTPRVLFGLRVGLEAEVVKADGSELPSGSTVVAELGDRIILPDGEEYTSPHLVPIREGGGAHAAAPEEPTAGPSVAPRAADAPAQPATPAEPSAGPVAAPSTAQ